MKKGGILILLIVLFSVISCGNTDKEQKGDVVVTTRYGDIRIRLYENTPEHKANFEKLIEEGFYKDLLFHRVIPDFMIQGGDPGSRNAEPGSRLGSGSPEYTLPAEIIPEYYHKRGAVAAARRGGPSNPEKRSSSSQFYIVEGRVFSEGAIDTLEMAKNQAIRSETITRLMQESEKEIARLQSAYDYEGYASLVAAIEERADSLITSDNLGFSYTPEQRKVYTTVGGYPSLDGAYTVFGEVIEGMEAVEKISRVETDNYDRPLQDVKMNIEKIK